MQALAARRLAEGNEAKLLEAAAQLLGRRDHGRECNVGRRVEIEDEPPGNGRMMRLAIPGMEFHRRDLAHGDQALDAIDLQIRLAVALDGDQLDEIGDAGHRRAAERSSARGCRPARG